jgi:hypothetical protein
MIRSVELAKVAAQAEGLRLRQMTRRNVFRAVFAAIAGIFVLFALAVFHVAGAIALAGHFTALASVLIIAGVDLVIVLVFGLLAARSAPGTVELEALHLRETAQAQLLETVALTSLIGPFLRLVGPRKVYGLALAALTARYLSGKR